MSQRVFWDTNIVLDLLGKREPFYTSAAILATMAERGKFTLIVSPLTFITTQYVLSKFIGSNASLNKLRRFKVLCEICQQDEMIIEKASNSSFSDFEDAVQYNCAVDATCDVIISRNPKDYKLSALPVLSAEEFLNSLDS